MPCSGGAARVSAQGELSATALEEISVSSPSMRVETAGGSIRLNEMPRASVKVVHKVQDGDGDVENDAAYKQRLREEMAASLGVPVHRLRVKAVREE